MQNNFEQKKYYKKFIEFIKKIKIYNKYFYNIIKIK